MTIKDEILAAAPTRKQKLAKLKQTIAALVHACVFDAGPNATLKLHRDVGKAITKLGYVDFKVTTGYHYKTSTLEVVATVDPWVIKVSVKAQAEPRPDDH